MQKFFPELKLLCWVTGLPATKPDPHPDPTGNTPLLIESPDILLHHLHHFKEANLCDRHEEPDVQRAILEAWVTRAREYTSTIDPTLPWTIGPHRYTSSIFDPATFTWKPWLVGVTFEIYYRGEPEVVIEPVRARHYLEVVRRA